MKCAVCSRKAKGFGYFNPRLPRSDPRRYSNRWVFCSMRCQNAFSRLMEKTGGHMIDPSDMELAAMASCLAPLVSTWAPSACSDRWRTTAKTKC